jgi:hypothetical protein
VEEEERAATENAGRAMGTKRAALTRSGAPTRRSPDSKRATGGFIPQAGVQGKMSGGDCCQTAGKLTPHGSLQSENSQRSPPKLGKTASSRLLLSSTYWWVFGQDARRRGSRRKSTQVPPLWHKIRPRGSS